MSKKTGIPVNKLSCVSNKINLSRNGWKLQGTTIIRACDQGKEARIAALRLRKGEKRPSTRGENNPRARAVINLDTLEVFETIKKAVECGQAPNHATLSAVCSGRRKTTGGYRWAYA